MCRRADDVAEGRALLGDVAANYLAWIDVTTEVLRDDGARLGTDLALINEATDTLRSTSRGSLLALIARFDTAHQRVRTELGDEQARLHHLAHHDPLTGLPNRRHLLDRLTDTVATTAHPDPEDADGSADATGARAGVFYLDVDRFKAVNDTHGHDIGDRLLRLVADRLREHTHPTDTLARIGGDEFVLICPHVHTPDDARAALHRLHHQLSAPVMQYPQAALTVSIGCALAHPGADPAELIARADTAMYIFRTQNRAQDRAHPVTYP